MSWPPVGVCRWNLRLDKKQIALDFKPLLHFAGSAKRFTLKSHDLLFCQAKVFHVPFINNLLINCVRTIYDIPENADQGHSHWSFMSWNIFVSFDTQSLKVKCKLSPIPQSMPQIRFKSSSDPSYLITSTFTFSKICRPRSGLWRIMSLLDLTQPGDVFRIGLGPLGYRVQSNAKK